MNRAILLLFFMLFLFASCNQGKYHCKLPKINSGNLKFAPEYYSAKPNMPSPGITKSGRELILLKTTVGKFAWMDGTVENGEPFDYKKRLYGKGNQLLSDAEDFPTFAKTGLHSDYELRNTKIITGRSVSQITVDGRPRGSSGVGFLAEDEIILSVIYADNNTVKKLGIRHPDIARPLFHFWNVARDFEKSGTDSATNEKLEFESLMYNGHEIQFKIQGSRGWQESIFNDEILGTGHIEIWRELTREESAFLKQEYSQLTEKQFNQLQKKLSRFHTSEMVFFYISRYGFYEGHNEYRPDPISVALIFGLTTIEKVHRLCGKNLYHYFTTHFTQNPE